MIATSDSKKGMSRIRFLRDDLLSYHDEIFTLDMEFLEGRNLRKLFELSFQIRGEGIKIVQPRHLRAAVRMAHEAGGLKSAWQKTRCWSIFFGGDFC